MASTTEVALANKMLEGSPLAGQGQAFVMAGEQNDVDWRLLIAIARSETNLGRTGGAQAIHNPFGLGPGITYGNWSQAIAAAARTIAGYPKRDTIADIGAKWAPVGAANDPRNLNSNWVRNVTAFYREYGGSPTMTRDPGGSSFKSIPGDAKAAVGDAAGAVTDAVSGPVEAVLAFLKDYVIRILAFLLLGVIGVWLIGQGANRAFGTPTAGEVIRTVRPGG